MRISDEIDALEVMGINSLVFLCASRLLAAFRPALFAHQGDGDGDGDRAGRLLLRLHRRRGSRGGRDRHADSMVLNTVMVHLVGMVGTQIFWGSNPRAPIGG
jgi:phospholipid/cholesterol/gamma-HCH transport system permease protein